MAYRFESGEAVDEAFHRCAREQLDRAVTELTDGVKADPVTAVHEARKALKRERSLLRLARGSVRSADRRRLNTTFRDAARELSGTRDADVMIKALDDLSERYAGQLPKRTFTALRDGLSERQQSARDALSRSGVTEKVSEQLKAARGPLAELQLRSGGWGAIEDGLLRSYRRGRRAFARAKRKPTVENLHEWRKRAKDHWYHLRLLQPIAPNTVKGQAKDAHQLSDLLGDDHDLAVLRHELRAREGEVAVDVDAVLALIDLRREQLQSEALALGARIYAEKPKALRRRLRSYWKAWRTQDRAAQQRRPALLARRTRVPSTA